MGVVGKRNPAILLHTVKLLAAASLVFGLHMMNGPSRDQANPHGKLASMYTIYIHMLMAYL